MVPLQFPWQIARYLPLDTCPSRVILPSETRDSCDVHDWNLAEPALPLSCATPQGSRTNPTQELLIAATCVVGASKGQTRHHHERWRAGIARRPVAAHTSHIRAAEDAPLRGYDQRRIASSHHICQRTTANVLCRPDERSAQSKTTEQCARSPSKSICGRAEARLGLCCFPFHRCT